MHTLAARRISGPIRSPIWKNCFHLHDRRRYRHRGRYLQEEMDMVLHSANLMRQNPQILADPSRIVPQPWLQALRNCNLLLAQHVPYAGQRIAGAGEPMFRTRVP